jgi:hypothetical protein
MSKVGDWDYYETSGGKVPKAHTRQTGAKLGRKKQHTDLPSLEDLKNVYPFNITKTIEAEKQKKKEAEKMKSSKSSHDKFVDVADKGLKQARSAKSDAMAIVASVKKPRKERSDKGKKRVKKDMMV